MERTFTNGRRTVTALTPADVVRFRFAGYREVVTPLPEPPLGFVELADESESEDADGASDDS